MKRHLQLSQEFLDDSIALLDQGRLRSAVDRAYYAIHYSAVALLCHVGVRPPRSHSGLVNVFGREVVTPGTVDREYGRMLSSALRSRTRSTYSADADIATEDAQLGVANARRFLSEARTMVNR